MHTGTDPQCVTFVPYFLRYLHYCVLNYSSREKLYARPGKFNICLWQKRMKALVTFILWRIKQLFVWMPYGNVAGFVAFCCSLFPFAFHIYDKSVTSSHETFLTYYTVVLKYTFGVFLQFSASNISTKVYRETGFF